MIAKMLGKDGRPKPNLVVRQHAPIRRIVLLAAVALLGLFALYVIYELGRYNAGYDRLAVAQERTEKEVEIERLEKTNHELRTKLAELDTIRISRAREQAEVARNIVELEGQLQHATQELAFYRGVVTRGTAELGVKIDQVRISPSRRAGQFILHLALLRSGKADNVVTGTMDVIVDGGSGDTPLDLSALTRGKQVELPFNFRFYQNFDQEIAIPPNFKPEHLAVEVHSSRKDIAPLEQSFLWNPEPAP
jgi:hypothetical protein